MATYKGETLRLVARDEADLEVVSALLQDSIITGVDMHYDVQQGCFMIVANRFCWERQPLTDVNDSNGGAVHERALCGVRINHVTGVQKRHWPKDWRHAFLNLLALKLVRMPQQTSDCIMEFSFSGGPSMRLATERINIVLGDLGSSQPTNLHPWHNL